MKLQLHVHLIVSALVLQDLLFQTLDSVLSKKIMSTELTYSMDSNNMGKYLILKSFRGQYL